MPAGRAATPAGCWSRSCGTWGWRRASRPAISCSWWRTSRRSTARRAPRKDFTDLHAWAEVFIPGAGWIGFDPTSGLLAGEGHIPLACTADPGNAAPVIGFTDVADVEFGVTMIVTRIHEDPRVTLPYTDSQWHAIDALGEQVDADLVANDVRLTQGGEPTFVSIDDMDGAEWNYAALSPKKRQLGEILIKRLQGQVRPRRASCITARASGIRASRCRAGRWAFSGAPTACRCGRATTLIADTTKPGDATVAVAKAFGERIAAIAGPAGVAADHRPRGRAQTSAAGSRTPGERRPAEGRPHQARRARAAGAIADGAGLGSPAGYRPAAQGNVADDLAVAWESSPWPLKRVHLYALPGDSPLGLRLPLGSLPELLPEEAEPEFPVDPFAPRGALPDAQGAGSSKDAKVRGGKPREVVKTALTLQVRDGHLYVFMPPCEKLEAYVALLAAVEDTAGELRTPVAIEGYTPPRDPRVKVLNVTPDPGVIEVNIHPASSWRDLLATTETLYEEARQSRLGTEKFMLDGRHTGTGGGNHVTLGGATPADSPLLRRPDLLRSLITYWQNHPALSYLFSGMFIGPTSQAPRVDEARDDRLYELAIAFQQLGRNAESGRETPQPWLVDRLLRHMLTDLTGNTHRAGIFDRQALFARQRDRAPGAARVPRVRDAAARADERRAGAAAARTGGALLARAVSRRTGTVGHRAARPLAAAAFRRGGHPRRRGRPEARRLRVRSGMVRAVRRVPLPALRHGHLRRRDAGTAAGDRTLARAGRGGEPGRHRALRRFVGRADADQGVGMTGGRHAVTCNGRALPLTPTGIPGEFVAGVRFRAWNPPSALHPTIGVQAPLTFDLIDTWSQRALGGCTYHVVHPGGRNYDTFPVNANEAEARRVARFWAHGHTPGPMAVHPEQPNPATPATLDLRWQPAR